MSDEHDRATEVLRRLVDRDGVQGACIVSRDGLPVLAEWPSGANVDTVAAMAAALMGAAEASLLEFGDRGIETVLVSSQGMQIAVHGVDDEVLLLAAMERTVSTEAMDEFLRASLADLGAILSEA